ncbi:MAG: hypothetical protein SGPRY_011519, partial [Prymnesium sp.]
MHTEMISSLLHDNDSPFASRPVDSPHHPSPSGGYFTMITSDSEGHERTFSGPVSQLGPLLPPELASDAKMLPAFVDEMFPEIARLVGGFLPPRPPVRRPFDGATAPEMMESRFPSPRKEYPIASIGDNPEEVAEANRLQNHPCGGEIMFCRETVGQSSDQIKRCLLDNLDKLSPRCKCFVHQVEGPERIQRSLPSSAQPASAPVVGTVPMHFAPMTDDSIATASPPSFVPRMHHTPSAMCFLVGTSAFVLFLLILRKCVRCFCCTSAAQRVAIVVRRRPSRTGAISTHEVDRKMRCA